MKIIKIIAIEREVSAAGISKTLAWSTNLQ